MIVVRTAEAAEQALTEGQLVCPAADVATPCGGGDMDGAGMCAASARR
ncbi:arginine-rich protein [Mycobacterium tuberculosis variant bovis BCG]|nr:arginine-rich protein [Mycobacterium tuberculosis variant bovis BCG]